MVSSQGGEDITLYQDNLQHILMQNGKEETTLTLRLASHV